MSWHIGELVRHRTPGLKHYLYTDPPRPNVEIISIATNDPWISGDVGVILEIDTRDIKTRNMTYLKILTSREKTGWVHANWVASV